MVCTSYLKRFKKKIMQILFKTKEQASKKFGLESVVKVYIPKGWKMARNGYYYTSASVGKQIKSLKAKK